MQNWGFSDHNGNEINRGWQGTEREARAKAQDYANASGEAVNYWDESDKSGEQGEGEPAETLVTVHPEA